ncbi:MAG TPA: ATP-dependent Clp protease proteolytic subunit [Aggregatilineales bacterium]|nr:ATP-dependent Clp protease proteolytic subunit [Aggregatilineales bacterium]
MMIPSVIETTGRGERVYDIYSLLLKERVVFVGAEIDDQIANLIVAQLLWLDREDSENEVKMYIQSPGGEVNAGFAIYDTMKLIRAPVSTYAIGLTASFGTILLTAGTKGRRYAMPSATIHMHQPLGGVQGQASDLVIHANFIVHQRERINQILMDSTGQPKDVIERDTDRDFYMDAYKAVEYGLIDRVLEPSPAPNANGKH